MLPAVPAPSPSLPIDGVEVCACVCACLVVVVVEGVGLKKKKKTAKLPDNQRESHHEQTLRIACLRLLAPCGTDVQHVVTAHKCVAVLALQLSVDVPDTGGAATHADTQKQAKETTMRWRR